MALLLINATAARDLADCGLDDMLPGAAADALEYARELRTAAAELPAAHHRRAALRVAGDTLWDAWRATERLEGHPDARLRQVRDDLEAAARTILGGLVGDEAAGVGAAAGGGEARNV
ncbi:hypothetical protein [Rhodovastum atsumiense]|uniref:Uncharacterized protein n=1 Tax=Rhodovastum atsumiense TaxID=504468 RepID=A0A5M6IWS5_9PROT|nr:hypothetical protein [Rhodovastum atsumiense]KAA5611825.1 hypothetical protein F1189_12365 [Rhodovastum atsumiense]